MFRINDNDNIYNILYNENDENDENLIELSVIKRKLNKNINWRNVRQKISDGDCTVLGTGAYGTVYSLLHDVNKIAVKVSEFNDNEDSPQSEKDYADPIDFGCCLSEGLRVMSPKSSRLTECFGVHIDEKKWIIYTAMEFCGGGDLSDFIESQTKLYEKTVNRFFYQMLQGVSQMNDHKIMHRDLKPGNIFITSTGDLKLGDFGLCGYKKTNNDLRHEVITRWYRPPELELQFEYTENVDVFSIGCIIMELFTKTPLIQSNENNHFKKVILATGSMLPECISYYDNIIDSDEKTFLMNNYKLNKYYEYRRRKWDLIKKFNSTNNKKSIVTRLLNNLNCTSELKEVILLALDKNPNTRPSASNLLKHPYFAKNIEKKVDINNNISLLPLSPRTPVSKKSDTVKISDFIWNTVSCFNYSNATFILSFYLFRRYITVTQVPDNKRFSIAAALIFIVATYITEHDTRSVSLDKYLSLPNAKMSSCDFRTLLSDVVSIITNNDIIPPWETAFEINSLTKLNSILLIYCMIEYDFEKLTVITIIQFVKRFLVLLEKYPSHFSNFNKICKTKSNTICSLCYDYFKENYSIFVSSVFSDTNVKYIFESDEITELISSYL